MKHWSIIRCRMSTLLLPTIYNGHSYVCKLWSNPLNKTCSWGYSRIFAMSCNDPEYPTSHKVYSWISINIRKINLLWRIFLNIWLWILDFPDILEHSYFEYSYLNIEEYSENPYSILFQYFTINISLYIPYVYQSASSC